MSALAFWWPWGPNNLAEWANFSQWVSVFPLVVGVGAFLRHKNCHERGCWRLSHHPEPWCRVHRPASS